MAKLDNLAKMAARATVQELYADLHGKIVRGDMRPGEMLSETKVADSYGVSRTPVREVFWRLGEDAFLRVVPQVGTFVAPINIASVYDSQFVRETLECTAVKQAARNAEPGDIARLHDQLALQAEAVAQSDYVAFFGSDETLHRLLMTMAGRPFVWQIIAGVKAQLDRVRFLSLEDPDWLAMVFAEHQALVEHVSHHDAEAARRIMRDHLRTAFAAIGRIAARHPDFFEGNVTPPRNDMTGD
ncbi:MAG TPA: GntR family transcriptional regulator [Acetobacteraceae bacterium]|jgi:DNA-binding GntR family transcriptional regulator